MIFSFSKTACSIFFLSSLLFAGSVSSLKEELDCLSSDQKTFLIDAYSYGKEFRYEYLLPAIAWQESKFNKIPVNVSDPSFGPYHFFLENIKNISLSKTGFQKNIFVSQLLKEAKFSTLVAIIQLQKWKKVHKNDLEKVIKSYNSGYNIDSKRAKRYYDAIALKMYVLKNYFSFLPYKSKINKKGSEFKDYVYSFMKE